MDFETIERQVKEGAEDKGTLTVEHEGTPYEFAFVNNPELGYWSALRSTGSIEDTVEMLDAIDKEHLGVLPAIDERDELDVMAHWASILQKYTDASDVEVRKEDAKIDPAAAASADADADADAADGGDEEE